MVLGLISHTEPELFFFNQTRSTGEPGFVTWLSDVEFFLFEDIIRSPP